MKFALLFASVLLGSHVALAQSVSKAKIGELSAHRIDRLVTLGKIDGSFQKRLSKIEVTEVSGPAPVAFRSVSSQTQPTSGQAMQLELQFDKDGKPLSFKSLTGGVAGPDLGWSPKNAGELVENGMHFVLDKGTDAAIAPYFKDFSSLDLVKGSLAGKDVAVLQVHSSAQTQTLYVYVNLDGSLNSTAIVP